MQTSSRKLLLQEARPEGPGEGCAPQSPYPVVGRGSRIDLVGKHYASELGTH